MRSITLIGMPASGKSTVGKALAAELGMQFLDLDIYIEEREHQKLALIVQERGDAAVLQIEEDCALEIPLNNTVFAPGGSLVYSSKAMERLQNETTIVFLTATVQEIKKRVESAPDRGIIGAHKSIEEIYQERLPLYQKYADITVDTSDRMTDRVVKEITAGVRDTIK